MTEKLLQQYFANQATPDEAQRVLNWFDTDEGRLYLQHRLDTQFEHSDWYAPPTAPHPDMSWQRIEPKISPTAPAYRSSIWKPNWLNQSLRWAAIFAGTLLLALGSYQVYRQLYPADLIQQTAYGKTSKLSLADGSVVTLNGNSCLRYAPRWSGGQTREVWLDGEGFFQVAHQPHHERFVVHLPNKLNIEVLGTQFDVMARESRAKVVLNAGKIRLDGGERSKTKVVMMPGDLVFADVSKKIYYRKRVDPAIQSSWQSGKLRFEGTTLQEVAQMLKETYGVDVIIADPDLRQQTLSGTVPNHNIETILNGLSTLFDLRITRKTNRIIIQ